MSQGAYPTPEDRRPVSFARWKAVLAAAGLSPETEGRFRQEIFQFLRHCGSLHTPASIVGARMYFAHLALQGRSDQEVERAKVALRWWFKAAKAAERGPAGGKLNAGSETAAPRRDEGVPTPPPRTAALGPTKKTEPPQAAIDLGATDWERDLIKACRERNFLWRTEQTYREWAARFAACLRPRTPHVATAEDVGGFLSKLAVEPRASPSTQKHALNAIVFLMQEALHRELGEIPFQRAMASRGRGFRLQASSYPPAQARSSRRCWAKLIFRRLVFFFGGVRRSFGGKTSSSDASGKLRTRAK